MYTYDTNLKAVFDGPSWTRFQKIHKVHNSVKRLIKNQPKLYFQMAYKLSRPSTKKVFRLFKNKKIQKENMYYILSGIFGDQIGGQLYKFL